MLAKHCGRCSAQLQIEDFCFVTALAPQTNTNAFSLEQTPGTQIRQHDLKKPRAATPMVSWLFIHDVRGKEQAALRD